jgi:DNA-binding CsgD family transcriptional regulator
MGNDLSRPAFNRIARELNPSQQRVIEAWLLSSISGKADKQIAAELRMTERYFNTNKSRGMRKLGIPNNAALVLFGIKTGIIPLYLFSGIA